MAHLTLLEGTVGFVLLIAGIYAFLCELWFLGVRFVPAWPFISLVRQIERDRWKDRSNPASLLNEHLKRRRNAPTASHVASPRTCEAAGATTPNAAPSEASGLHSATRG